MSPCLSTVPPFFGVKWDDTNVGIVWIDDVRDNLRFRTLTSFLCTFTFT